jgi:endonuclease YncB( thermonuclease family)
MRIPGTDRRGRGAALPSLRRGRAIVLAGLAGLGALALLPGGGSEPLAAQSGVRGTGDGERALFPMCGGGRRVTCVVDGDTIWYRGAKIRIADIDTPEVSQPGCPREAALGRQATERMRDLLNAGAFSLEVPPSGRTRDRFGRELRVIKRGGRSLGNVLVREGLAERWGGPKRRWC